MADRQEEPDGNMDSGQGHTVRLSLTSKSRPVTAHRPNNKFECLSLVVRDTRNHRWILCLRFHSQEAQQFSPPQISSGRRRRFALHPAAPTSSRPRRRGALRSSGLSPRRHGARRCPSSLLAPRLNSTPRGPPPSGLPPRCQGARLFFSDEATKKLPVAVGCENAAAARRLRPALGHGWIRLLLPHGRRLPVPESRRGQIPSRPPHPHAGAAPIGRGCASVALVVQGGGAEQVRSALYGHGTVGYTGGGIRTEANYGNTASDVHKLVINCCCILSDMHYSVRIILEGCEAKYGSHNKL